MAPKRWAVDASPLILLGKTDNLGLLSALAGRIVVPRAVIQEIGAKPEGSAVLQWVAREPACAVVDDQPASPEILSWDLGAGETQVIAQAQSQGADRVVIDDLAARRCAKAMGLRVIGTLGIVGRAKAAGLIDRAEPAIRRLRETGLYASDELVQRLLREVGE